MSLLEQISADMKEAMKAKETLRLGTIRQLRSAVKNKEIELGAALDDEAVIAVISTQVKQRREAAQMYRENQRPELADKEDAELAVLQTYLPAQLSEDELRQLIATVMTETGATSPRDMGKVMPQVMARTKGAADGKLVSRLVKEMLAG
ncbi:MAG: glutamyl-tRNA amidotransferase [Desulfuromonas sp.]|nr:MAG: glutamyl-tRNA amidotransferase [Desulfuromonas sp.]